MGLLMIWDDIHRHIGKPGGRRSKRAREWLDQHIEDNWFSEHWMLKVGEEILEKKINTKHDVLVKNDKISVKKVLDDIKIDISFIK